MRATWIKRFLFVLAVLAVTGLSIVVWRVLPYSIRYYTDADAIREPIAKASPRDVLWQPPTPVHAPNLNTDLAEYEPKLSADGLALYFVRGKAGENADIYESHRNLDGWDEPAPLTAINSDDDELGPEPSADGNALYFYSNRVGGFGGYDLWVSLRGTDDWEPPVNVGEKINTPFNEYNPALTPDGKLLYFASNRPRPGDGKRPTIEPWRATLREDWRGHDYDLYFASIENDDFLSVLPVTELNTPFNEGCPAVSPVGDFLYFSSDRSGGSGGFDLYRSRRMRGAHQPAVSLGPTINTPANELDPALGSLGYALYFSSDRNALGPKANRESRYDVYFTTSREVFEETETIQRASIGWAALWSKLWPNLLAALIALTLIALLIWLLGDVHRRRLSLPTKCLLVSLLAHLVILFLLTFWSVTTSVAVALREGGGGKIHVTMAAGNTGSALGEITQQVRGGFTTIDSASPERARANPSAPVFTPNVEPRHVFLGVDPPSTPLAAPIQAAMQTESVVRSTVPVKLHLPESSATQSEPPPLSISLPAQMEPRAAAAEQTAMNAAAAPSDVAAPRVPVGTLTSIQSPTAQLPPMNVTQAATMALSPSFPDPRTAAPQTQFITQASNEPKPLALVQSETRLSLPGVAEKSAAPAEPSVAVAPSRITGEINSPAIPTGSLSNEVQLANLAPTTGNYPAAGFGAPAGNYPTVNSKPSFVLQTASGSPAPSDLPIGSATALPIGLPKDVLVQSGPGATGSASEESLALRGVSAPSGGADVKSPVWRPAASGTLDSVAIVPEAKEFGQGEFPGRSTGLPFPELAGKQRSPGIANNTGQDSGKPGSDLALGEGVSLSLSLPGELPLQENPYAQRAPEQRSNLLEQMGGSEQTEHAVARGLAWLAKHQANDGHWDGADFDHSCGACGGQTTYQVNIALTGLSLLSFLGGDHTHAKDGPYRQTVDRGIKWLLARQKPDGDLRNDSETMYSHGIATIALAEAYGMTHDGRLAEPVARAIHFIERARNERVGGWRYDPGQVGDTSVLGWQALALKSAQRAGLDVAKTSFEAVTSWLDLVAVPARRGIYAYQPSRETTPAMTAEGMFLRYSLGARREDATMTSSADFLVDRLPSWDQPNTYYWYYATLAMFQHQGDAWSRWNSALKEQLLSHQHNDGPVEGSWDPVGDWADVGGRVYQTAICTLMLEVYYRYLPMYKLDTGLSDAVKPQTQIAQP